MTCSDIKYLIIGCGAVGGSIGGFLAHYGCNVTFIARGQTHDALKENGLMMHSDIIGNRVINNIAVFTADKYEDKADVIFVCVKDYSLKEVYSVIEKASHSKTLVIPVLNTFNVGQRIADNVSAPIIYDGCIYIVASLENAGIIKQETAIFKVICGHINKKLPEQSLILSLQSDMKNSLINFQISEDIRCAKFVKFSLTSAIASVCSYYDIPAIEVQKAGKYREILTGMCTELKSLSTAMGLKVDIDIVEDNLKIIDKFPPEATTSMHRDISAGKTSEIDGLVFDVIKLGEKYNIDMKNYKFIASKFDSTYLNK